MPYKDPEKRKQHMKEYSKQYRVKNKEKYQEYQKEYREKNKVKEREKQKRYRESEKGKKYKQQYYKSDKGIKISRISNWKKNGITSTNFDLVYERYINTNYCEVCNIELITGRDNTSNTRCLDHQHASGEIRNIVCKRCNCNRQKIDLNHMYVLQELHRYFRRIET